MEFPPNHAFTSFPLRSQISGFRTQGSQYIVPMRRPGQWAARTFLSSHDRRMIGWTPKLGCVVATTSVGVAPFTQTAERTFMQRNGRQGEYHVDCSLQNTVCRLSVSSDGRARITRRGTYLCSELSEILFGIYMKRCFHRVYQGLSAERRTLYCNVLQTSEG